ncbi:BACON domain-containing protein [Larkinella rosea]|uniref:BACON domain-containing protein n=1 Tax=Larkinella rosea TaxID=2025312 RepID=UPI00163AD279|nr:BACON domain-containing carbohydrate-binding protein [Larkinella rosea]
MDNDPVRFQISSSKKEVVLGEEIEITIKAHLLSISPSLLFTFEGSNSFRLKLLIPDGFVTTGGTYTDLVGQELTRANPTVQYTLKGYFTKIGSINDFRLLRGNGSADQHSLFVEKAQVTFSVLSYDQIAHHSSARAMSTICQESEAAKPSAASNEPAASGGQFVSSGNSSEFVDYTLTAASSGTATLTFSYATSETPTAKITINGVVQPDLALTSTGSWNVFQTKTFTASLNSGSNTIRITTGGGTFRQDKLCLEDSQTSGCNLTMVRVYPRTDCPACVGRTVGAQIQVSTVGKDGPWTTILTIPSGETTSWREFPVSGGTGNYKAIRYVSPTAANCNVAELEFYASTTKLTGTVFADAGGPHQGNQSVSADKAFDGNTSTYYDALNPTGGYVGLELISCSGGGTTNNLVVSPLSINASAPASTPTISVTANVAWTVSESLDWLSVSSSSGSNNGSFTINITANTTTSVRSGSVTVSGGGITQTINVSQAQASTTGCSLTLIRIHPRASCCSGRTIGGQVQVSTVGKDGPWTTVLTIPTEATGWNEFTLTGQTGAYKAIRYLAPNASYGNVGELEFYSGTTKFTGTTFGSTSSEGAGNNFDKAFDGNVNTHFESNTSSGGYVGLELTNCAGGGTTNNLVVSPTTVSASSASSTPTITITSNVAWTASENLDWLSLNASSGSNNGSFMINITANTTSNTRSGSITVTGGGITQTITVSQSPASGGSTQCTPFTEVCSGNQSEIRNQTITVATGGTYTMLIHYKSSEKAVTSNLLIDGIAQSVTYPQTSTYLDKTVSNVVLTAGNHVIGLSSGADGGYICFDKICLSGSGGNGNCPQTPTASVSNPTPNCGTSVSLSAGCSGTDCSGVSYTWNGNGLNQNGQTVALAAPSTNGFYSYTVTMSKSGCSTTTAVVSLTVSSCTSSVISDLRLAIPEMAFDMENPLQNSSGSFYSDDNKQFGVVDYQYTNEDRRVPILPWMVQLRNGATALNGRTMGGHGWATWTKMKPDPAGQNGGSVWQRGHINPYWTNQIRNQLTYCQQNNLKLGLMLVPYREQSKTTGFLTTTESQYAQPTGDLTNQDGPVMHMEYATAALTNLNDFSNPAVRMYWDFYDAITEIKSFHESGVLTYATLGMRRTHEIGYDLRGGAESIFGDYHEVAHEGLRTWLKGKLSGSNDAQKLQTLNGRWGTNYQNWSEVQISYSTYMPLLNSFNDTPKGREILAYRMKSVADMMCLMAKAWWTQCPGIHMVLDIGQIFGGQAMATGTCDIAYLLQRLKALQISMGATGKIVVKLNGAAWDNLSYHATALRQICQQNLGYSFVITELDYGSGHWNGTNIEGRPLSDVVDNIYQFQRYSGGNASITFLDGNSWEAVGGGRAVAQAYLQKTNRATAPYSFCYDGNCSSNVLTTGVRPMLVEGYNLESQMKTGSFNYLNQDVRINFQSLTEYN